MFTAVKALKIDFGTIVAKRDEEIQGMTDLVRRLQPIADRCKVPLADKYKVLFTKNKELQNQFDAVLSTNHELQQMLRNMQSEKAAADSQVKELTMVVSQVMAENEELTQQSSVLVQQNEVQIAFDFCCVCTWNPTACVFTSVYSTNLIVVLMRY